jgi:hypothetical protein
VSPKKAGKDLPQRRKDAKKNEADKEESIFLVYLFPLPLRLCAFAGGYFSSLTP